MSDLKSNEGKVLYDDGEHQIYVSIVIIQNKKYQVYFRTSGKYSLHGASLVSATKHSTVENGWFTSTFEANAFATYHGYTFKVYETGTSGLNYKDGDEFGLYLIFVGIFAVFDALRKVNNNILDQTEEINVYCIIELPGIAKWTS